MSPSRPSVTTHPDWTSRDPRLTHRGQVVLPGASGFRPMPRKMAGIAMITIEASIVAIVMLSVVLDRAIHLYRSGRPPAAGAEPFTCPESTLCRTLTQSSPRHLLNGNYPSG